MTMTRKNWTLSRSDLADVQFHVMPRDAGQIVEISYGLWADGAGGGLVIQRRNDQSSADVDYIAAEAGETFEPWNGNVETVGEWLPLVTR